MVATSDDSPIVVEQHNQAGEVVSTKAIDPAKRLRTDWPPAPPLFKCVTATTATPSRFAISARGSRTSLVSTLPLKHADAPLLVRFQETSQRVAIDQGNSRSRRAKVGVRSSP